MQISQLKLGNVSKWIVSDGEGTREIQGEPYSRITAGSKISSNVIHDHMPLQNNMTLCIKYGAKSGSVPAGAFFSKNDGPYCVEVITFRGFLQISYIFEYFQF